MIPKIIHYIWLGKGEKPEIFQQCFDSWKKFCPDYEFMLWDESNVDLDSYPYVREAYDAKKYAFVSDVVRLQKLYEYGGVYLDIDVELLRPIDEFLAHHCFGGFEVGGLIAPGLIFGSEKGNEDLKNILDTYKDEHFVVDGKYNYKTICTRFDDYYEKFGLKQINKLQKLENIVVYPSKYFCPRNFSNEKFRVKKMSYAKHYYWGSWVNAKDKKHKLKYRIKAFIRLIVGDRIYNGIKKKIKRKKK